MTKRGNNTVSRVRTAARRVRQSDTFTALVNSVTTSLSDPRLLLVLGLLAIVAVTHVDPTKGFLNKVVDYLKGKEGTKAIGEFLGGHLAQTVGALFYTAVSLFLAKQKDLGLWMTISVAAGYLLPSKSAYQYLSHAALLALYLRSSRKDVKLALVVVSAGLWAVGYIA